MNRRVASRLAVAGACLAVAMLSADVAVARSHLPSPSVNAVLRDYSDNDRIDRRHSCSAVEGAIRYLSGPTDAPMPGAINFLRHYAAHVCRSGSALQIVGGTAEQRRLARLVASRVGGLTLREVRFEPPRAVLRHMHVRGTEMVVTSSEPGTVRGEWELHLYAGTFVALNARYRVPLGGIVAGEREGPVSLWRPFDLYSQLPTSLQIGALNLRLTEAVARAQAKILELRTAATSARAIALTLQVSDPAAFLKHRALSILNLLYRTRVPLLGFYVGLKDDTGRLVWATSRLPNEGAVYATPALDACSPVKHFERPFIAAKRPSCPAK